MAENILEQGLGSLVPVLSEWYNCQLVVELRNYGEMLFCREGSKQIMKLSIMQPYYFPYIAYFQLIKAVDKFVIYDNIQFTKSGWFRRNRLLDNGKEKLFTIPVKKDSHYLNVAQRELAGNFDLESKTILRRIEATYRKAPRYKKVMPVVGECFQRGSGNLFQFIYTSLLLLLRFLEIDTDIIKSSSIDIDCALKGQDRVLAIAKSLNADIYINAIDGQKLYSREVFRNEGMELNFINTKPIVYRQFGDKFIPGLSIIDVMMFNSREQIKGYLNHYNLLD
ncbi:MAG: WbqC family protein [Candidatus Omnitrophota bacterium]|nr:WbqC family protein [Candidatus Omnitrophota bacterium]